MSERIKTIKESLTDLESRTILTALIFLGLCYLLFTDKITAEQFMAMLGMDFMGFVVLKKKES